ncbi:hypothetical protein ABW20_dc0103879 [Dactylellina cionopaga]|nr:hypothetical protein ABW20_dc0103879 [Dactylellina cionopaga]
MRFHLPVVSILAVVSTAIALPAAEPAAVAEPAALALARAKPSADSKELAKRGGNWLNCWTRLDSSIGRWEFYIDTWGDWDNDWGHGFLDNLRGECQREIVSWGFWYDDGNTLAGGHAHFFIWNLGNAQCVLNAGWDASNPTGAIWGATCGWF